MKPRHSYQFSLADMLFCSISALVILAAQALLTTLFGKPLPTGIFLLAIYAAGVFLFLYLRRRPSEALGRDDSLSKVASVLSDAVIQMDIPVVICPANADRIIWHNKAANYLFADTKQENHFGQLFFHLPQTNEDGGEQMCIRDSVHSNAKIGFCLERRRTRTPQADFFLYGENKCNIVLKRRSISRRTHQDRTSQLVV